MEGQLFRESEPVMRARLPRTQTSLSNFSPFRGPLRFITSHSRATRVSRSPLRKTKRLRRRQRSRAIIKRLWYESRAVYVFDNYCRIPSVVRMITLGELLIPRMTIRSIQASVLKWVAGFSFLHTHKKKTSKKIIKKNTQNWVLYKAKSSRSEFEGLFTWRWGTPGRWGNMWWVTPPNM